jgi:malate dehydrogenase
VSSIQRGIIGNPELDHELFAHQPYHWSRLFGVTTLDVVRASTFVAEKLGDISLASSVSVPVIGGHSGVTVSLHTISQFRFPFRTQPIPQIVPLFSQSSHSLPPGFTASDLEALTTRVQFGGDEVVKAKDGAGSATLSMAYAGAEFAAKIIRAIKGETGITAPTYINLASHASGGEALKEELGKELEYFSAVVELGVGPISSRVNDLLW